MIDFQEKLTFSRTHCQKRLAQAYQVFGKPVVVRLLGFVLYLLGGKREDIAKLLDLPVGTFFSLLTRLHHVGLDGFQDRRARRIIVPAEVACPAQVEIRTDQLCIESSGKRELILPRDDALRCRVVLLSFLENEMLSSPQVCEALEISPRHLRLLRQKLRQEGASSLVDQRQGQQQDYRVDAETKGQIIQQFVVDVITGKHPSGEQLAKELADRGQKKLPSRTIRLHLRKLGLRALKESLPALLAEVKKKS